MKKIIIFLLAIMLFVPATVSAKEKKPKFQNKTSLLVREYRDSTGTKLRYGLKRKRKTLLEPQYYMRFNQAVRVFVFYTEHEIYVIDEYGGIILHEESDNPEWAGVEVLIEPVRIREDVQCYEINLYFVDSDLVIMRNFGIFFHDGEHLYKILTEPQIIPMN